MNNLGLPEGPDPNEQTLPQPPIFLPAPPQEQQAYIQPQQPSPSGGWAQPQAMGNRPLLPANSATGTNRSWKSDPAYRILFIAIGVVLLSSLTCVAVLAAMFNQPSSQNTQRGGPNTQQIGNIGGVRLGSPTPMATSTPTPTPIPTPTPTPFPTPTPTPITSNLTLSVINPVPDGTTVPVNITGSKPGARITLVITYTNATAFGNTNLSQNADDAGNATISWNVEAIPNSTRKPVTAQLQVTAQDGQGYMATTQTVVTVKVS